MILFRDIFRWVEVKYQTEKIDAWLCISAVLDLFIPFSWFCAKIESSWILVENSSISWRLRWSMFLGTPRSHCPGFKSQSSWMLVFVFVLSRYCRLTTCTALGVIIMKLEYNLCKRPILQKEVDGMHTIKRVHLFRCLFNFLQKYCL